MLFRSSSSNFVLSRDFFNLISLPRADQGLRFVSYTDVLNNRVDPNTFDNSVVFIGATAAGLGDIITTPIGAMAGVELNAWIFHNLRNQAFIQQTAKSLQLLLCIGGTLFFCLLLAKLSPRAFLLGTVASLAFILAISLVSLIQLKAWFPPFSLFFSILLFFPFWSWLRIERALRFLQREFHELSLEPLNTSDENTFDPIESRKFLYSLNIIEESETLRLSEQGKILSKQLCKDLQKSENKKNIETYWLNKIALQGNKESSNGKKIRGVELIAKTISQVSSAKKSAQTQRKLIESSLSQLQDAVCMVNILGNITFTNPAFSQIFKRELAQSASILNCIQDVALFGKMHWPELLVKLFDAPHYLKIEGTIESNSISLLIQAALIRTNNEEYDTFLFSFTDISELKAAERAKADALSFLSHDLRSPMVSVLAILEQLKTRSGSELTNTQSLDAIEELVKRNLDYADSFLHLSRAESTTHKDLQLCDAHSVLDSAHAYAKAKIVSTNYELTVSRCDDEAWLLADYALLERAMANLISNAAKYGGDRGSIELKLFIRDEMAVLSVSDCGEGIDKNDKHTIFEKFSRLNKQRQKPGAGLGLNFVATVAKNHNGKVSIIDNKPRGSTFEISLPSQNV